MANILAAAAGYGGYISPVKLIVLIVLFFAWIPLVNWVYRDTKAVKTNTQSWTLIMSSTGAGALLIWLLAPLFLIGLLIYIIAVGAAATAYIVHRNARVADFEKVLTSEHIKSIFVNESKKMDKASRGFSLITANGNDVPLPEPKSPEAFGFQTTCEIVEDALWRRASDIVFRPTAEDYSVMYFVDGLATKQDPRSREEMEYFISYLKQMGDMDINEKRKPQKGKFKAVRDDERVGWEILTAGSTAGEQLKLTRTQEYNLMKVDEVGFTASQVEAISGLRDLPKGLFIISGPKKSGITSSMYALLRNHDPFMNNINTLEKEPAAELQNITQHTFSLSDTGTTTYARKLQTILRMGPDIMGVEDCSDKGCAPLATAGAKDDRVMYVTLEATSAMQALGKWLNMVSDKNLVANTLVGISNQRLVRVLCDECKQAYQPNQELFKKFNIPAGKIKVLYRPGEIEYDKHGKPIVCEKCQGTGFYGRTAIFETVVLDDELKEVIRQAQSLQEISSRFRRAGMLYLQEESIKKVAKGITSINEVIRMFSSKTKPRKKRS
ncbi:MAG: Flp pilus assembly complex ATPase component TadA [Planctomycetes bacterium]|nr:Flp pilus assembly complex ATPase component TadA [Planctomycetota bacterium]